MLDFGYYNMDCMEGMKQFPDKYFDLAIVDPPYGGNDAIGLSDNKDKTKQATARKQYKIFENVAPEQSYFDELKRVSKKQIIWGCNFYEVKGLSGGRIVWDKHGTAFGRAEEAYYSHSKSIEIFEYTWNGMLQENMKNKEFRIHPTQKPVKTYSYEKKKTNADKIRAMSDEELAEFLTVLNEHCLAGIGKIDCSSCDGYCEDNCRRMTRKWLQSEAE